MSAQRKVRRALAKKARLAKAAPNGRKVIRAALAREARDVRYRNLVDEAETRRIAAAEAAGVAP